MISKISLDIKKGIGPKKVFRSKKTNLKLRVKIKKKNDKITNTPIKCIRVTEKKKPQTQPHRKTKSFIDFSPTKHPQYKCSLSLLFSNLLFDTQRKNAVSAGRMNPNDFSFESIGQINDNDENNKQLRYSQLRTTHRNYSFEDSNSYIDTNNNQQRNDTKKDDDENNKQRKVTFSVSPIKINKSFCYSHNLTSDGNLFLQPMTFAPSLRSTMRNEDFKGKLYKSYHKRISVIDGFTHIGQFNSKTIINQDAYSVTNNFHRKYKPSETYCAIVCDGYGVNGHLISNYIANRLSNEMRYNLSSTPNCLNDSYQRNTAISTAYNDLNEKLKKTTIDVTLSGSTCCAIIATPQSLICSNIGNSRAVMGSFRNNKWVSYELSRDHTPDIMTERIRITGNGGLIQSSKEDKTLRVWMKDETIPGLKTKRGFGNIIGSTIGIVTVPEIKEYKLTAYDKYFLIASDGLWNVISSQESVEMISEFYITNDVKGAINCLFKEAQTKWLKTNNNENYKDDITIVLAFFE